LLKKEYLSGEFHSLKKLHLRAETYVSVGCTIEEEDVKLYIYQNSCGRSGTSWRSDRTSKLCLGNLVARGLGRKTIYYNESIACRGWSHGSYVILCEVRRRRLEISATKLIGRGLTGEYCDPPGAASEQVSPKGVRDLNKSATRVRRWFLNNFAPVRETNERTVNHYYKPTSTSRNYRPYLARRCRCKSTVSRYN